MDECDKCDEVLGSYRIRLRVGEDIWVCSNRCLYALAGHGLDDKPSSDWTPEQTAFLREAVRANEVNAIVARDFWDAFRTCSR